MSAASPTEIEIAHETAPHRRRVLACYSLGVVPNLATGVYTDDVGTVLLVVQNTVAPTDDEWDRYVDNIRRCIENPNGASIAFTDGGHPNTLQRGRVNDVLAGRRAPSAVVSTSLALRGVVTALRWFNPDTASFSPTNIDAALRFAKVDGSRILGVWRMVLALDRQLSVPSRVVAEAAQALRKAG
jgi:hypothetical protein